MTKEELTRIRKNMPEGFLKILSGRTGKTIDAVSKALRGVMNSVIIINAAIELAKETKEKKESIRKSLDEL